MATASETADEAPDDDPDPTRIELVALWNAATSMLALDAAAQSLGIELRRVEPGHAIVSMLVTNDMVNGLEVCHGGIIFTLADTAMAVASNTCGSRTLASSAAIEFLAPARVGDLLTATCSERIKPGRSALNDSTVVNHVGVTIAEFRGRTVTVG